MLSITAKVRKLTEELDSAIKFSKDLLGILKDVSADQLTDKIGIFARQAPDWKILTDERKNGIDFIRQICTGEISIGRAIDLTQKLISDLESTRRLIKL